MIACVGRGAKNFSRCAASATILVLSVGCGDAAPPQVEVVPSEVLMVLDGASNVRHLGTNDGEVSYTLDEPHPATKTIATIRARLEASGWKPENEDFMNPGLQNAHVRGWADYVDGTKGDAQVFVWIADWSSARGDVVRYALRYVYPKGSGPHDARPPLEVSGMYMSALTVNRLRP